MKNPSDTGYYSAAGVVSSRGFCKCLLSSTFVILALSACSQPIVRVQYVTVKSYLPIPATLTAPIAVDLTGMTYGEGLGSLRAGLERCDGQLAAIRVLTPPSPPHK